MKKCAYCGTEHQDDAVQCYICHERGFNFVSRPREFKTDVPPANRDAQGSGLDDNKSASELLQKYSNLIARSGGGESSKTAGGSVNEPASSDNLEASKTSAISAPEPKADIEATPAVIPPGDWYYAVGKEKFGPISGQVIVDKVKSRELDENSKLWTEGLAKWVLLKNSVFRDHVPKLSGPPPLEEVDTGGSAEEAKPLQIPNPKSPSKPCFGGNIGGNQYHGPGSTKIPELAAQ